MKMRIGVVLRGRVGHLARIGSSDSSGCLEYPDFFNLFIQSMKNFFADPDICSFSQSS